MTKGLLLFGVLACMAVMLPVHAQESVGKKFGSRDPRTCASRKGALTAAKAKQYFICDQEYASPPNASGESITLVSDVTVQLGNPRPYNANMDSTGFETSNSIDPSQQVVPIQGSFNEYVCGKIGQINAPAGSNCNLTTNPHSKGMCFKSSFGDWHCMMTDLAGVREFKATHAPPTQP